MRSIGRFDLALSPPERPLAAGSTTSRNFTGYEVVMDVFPDVFAYGILLLPKGIKEGEKRPGGGLPAWAGRAAAGRCRPQGR